MSGIDPRRRGCGWLAPCDAASELADALGDSTPRSLVRTHSNSGSGRSASPARDVSRIGPATDCETLLSVGLLWGEKSLVNDSLGLISLVGKSAESNS
jgi:hypothetical protein